MHNGYNRPEHYTTTGLSLPPLTLLKVRNSQSNNLNLPPLNVTKVPSNLHTISAIAFGPESITCDCI